MVVTQIKSNKPNKKIHKCVVKSEIKITQVRRSKRIQEKYFKLVKQRLSTQKKKQHNCISLHIKMENLKKVEDLSFEGNVAENWRIFKKSYDIFEIALNVHEKKDDTRIAVFLNAAGKDALELFDTLPINEDNKKKFDQVIKAFEDFCMPKKNMVYERFVFYSRNQKEGETFDTFLIDIKKLSKTCGFDNCKDDMVRDRIVLGITDKNLQEKMLKKDISLEEAIKLCRATELSKNQCKVIQKDKIMEQNVHLVQTKQYNNPLSNNKLKSKQQQTRICNRCKTSHERNRCPAFGKTCNNCTKPNHFAIACRTKNVKYIQTVENDDGADVHSIRLVKINNISDYQINFRKQRGWNEFIRVNDTMVSFKFDTGSDVNILPLHLLKQIDNNAVIHRTSDVLEAYNKQKIVPIGECFLVCMYKNEVTLEKFLIINEDLLPILGLPTIDKWDLIKKSNKHSILDSVNDIKKTNLNDQTKSLRQKIISTYQDVFTGIGKSTKKYSICLRSNITPIARPARRVPSSLHLKLKAKLKKMVEENIISKVDEPREWVHNLVTAQKSNGDLRICLDPKELNKHLIKEQFLVPTLDEISEKLLGSGIYSVLDLKEGFWQLQIDENSQKLCTFSTPFGNYQFNRLPYGICVATELFQKFVCENFADIPNVIAVVDDILIYAKDIEEHDKALLTVMERARKLNIKFNPDKFQCRVDKVRYLGHIFSKQGMSIDTDRVRAIQELKYPHDKKSLQKFLGTVNYLRQFTPKLSQLTEPLRELLKKETIFQWTETHSKAIDAIKEKISNSPVLQSFDPNNKIVIQTDASQHGLGSCLIQNGLPVAYASRSLSDTEKRYAQIEKEFLAITFACKKFHYYIYGRPVEVKSDHKPLIPIMDKDIHKIPSAKLQRMRLKLLNYNLKVEYVPGKYLHIADYLSRNHIDTGNSEEDEAFTQAILSLSVGSKREEELRIETQKDEILAKISEYCHTAWPKDKSKIPPNIQQYFKIRNEVFLENGILFYNERIIVPQSLRPLIIKLLHESHMGINKSQKRAREIFFWPMMNNDIVTEIQNCPQCIKYGKSLTNEPLIPHEIPTLPFNKVACDIFEFKNQNFLIIVDYFSKWIEIRKIKNKDSKEIIRVWIEIFSTFGIPKQIIADNVPFNSFDCRQFATRWDIEISTSSPRYPKSNGLAERGVQIVKNILKKSKSDEETSIAMLEYRNTPTKDLSLSPAQLMFNHRLRTKLPISNKLLEPRMVKGSYDQLISKSLNNKKYYDRTAKEKANFEVGQRVFVQKDTLKHWEPARVIAKHKAPRSYIIKDENECIYRRNSKFLKPDKRSRPNLTTMDTHVNENSTLMQSTTRSGKIYK